MKNRWLVFIAYLLLSLVFYHKSLQVYFLSDDWKLFYLLDRYGFSAIAFNFESEFIRIIPCVLLSALYFLFGVWALPFHLLSILLHGANAFLVFVLAEKIFSRYLKEGNSLFYSIIAGLIFLSLPYQVEAVTWMSGTSDLLACGFVLLSLNFYFDFKNSIARKHLILSVFFFLLAVLSKESSLFLPLLIFVSEITRIGQRRPVSSIAKTVAVYFVPILIYASLNRFLTGYFITPGVSIFTNMTFALFAENYFLYAAKFFALYRLLSYEIRDILKWIIEYREIFLPVIVAMLLLVYILLKKKLRLKKPEGRIIAFFLVAMLISLLPVIHLETSFVGSPQSDRYGYLPAAFFVILVSAATAVINRKVIVTAVLCLLVVWFYTEVQIQNRSWVRASVMVKKIVKEFHPADGVSYITNVPDNFNGTYFLRNGLSEAVSVTHHHDFLERIHMISYHTITSEKDKASAELMSDSACRVTFAEPEGKIPLSEKIFTVVPDTLRYFYSEISDTSFVVMIKKLPSKSTFYFYSGGTLNAIY